MSSKKEWTKKPEGDEEDDEDEDEDTKKAIDVNVDGVFDTDEFMENLWQMVQKAVEPVSAKVNRLTKSVTTLAAGNEELREQNEKLLKALGTVEETNTLVKGIVASADAISKASPETTEKKETETKPEDVLNKANLSTGGEEKSYLVGLNDVVLKAKSLVEKGITVKGYDYDFIYDLNEGKVTEKQVETLKKGVNAVDSE